MSPLQGEDRTALILWVREQNGKALEAVREGKMDYKRYVGFEEASATFETKLRDLAEHGCSGEGEECTASEEDYIAAEQAELKKEREQLVRDLPTIPPQDRLIARHRLDELNKTLKQLGASNVEQAYLDLLVTCGFLLKAREHGSPLDSLFRDLKDEYENSVPVFTGAERASEDYELRYRRLLEALGNGKADAPYLTDYDRQMIAAFVATQPGSGEGEELTKVERDEALEAAADAIGVRAHPMGDETAETVAVAALEAAREVEAPNRFAAFTDEEKRVIGDGLLHEADLEAHEHPTFPRIIELAEQMMSELKEEA